MLKSFAIFIISVPFSGQCASHRVRNHVDC